MLEPKEQDDNVDGAGDTAIKDQPQISSPGIILKRQRFIGVKLSIEVHRFKYSITTHGRGSKGRALYKFTARGS